MIPECIRFESSRNLAKRVARIGEYRLADIEKIRRSHRREKDRRRQMLAIYFRLTRSLLPSLGSKVCATSTRPADHGKRTADVADHYEGKTPIAYYR